MCVCVCVCVCECACVCVCVCMHAYAHKRKSLCEIYIFCAPFQKFTLNYNMILIRIMIKRYSYHPVVLIFVMLIWLFVRVIIYLSIDKHKLR